MNDAMRLAVAEALDWFNTELRTESVTVDDFVAKLDALGYTIVWIGEVDENE